MKKNNQFNFTRAAILALPVPSKRTPHRDLKVRAFRLIHHPTGNVTFEVYRKVKGKSERAPLGTFDSNLPESREFEVGFDPLTLLHNSPSLNVKMARIFANAVNLELDKGISIAQLKKEVRRKELGEINLRQAFDKYVNEHLIPNGKKTINDITDNFERYLGAIPPDNKKPHGLPRVKKPGSVNWENRKLSSITNEDVRKLMLSLNEGFGKYTANRTYQSLRAIYNKAIEWGYFSGPNPCNGIVKFKEEKRSRFVQANELPKFFKAVNESKRQYVKDFIYLALFTGARRENVISMRWEDLDFYQRMWTIPADKAKSTEEMYIPLTQKAIEILESRQGNESEWVFPSDSVTGHIWSPKKYWSEIRVDAGIPDLRIHDLRRSLGSWAANTGASLPIIGEALGHKSQESTKIYARLSNEPVLMAMEKATEMMIKLAEADSQNSRSGDTIKTDTPD